MFNFGGIMSGLGQSAAGQVKFGRKAKHDREMLNTQEELRKEAVADARSYSRTEQTRKERKAIKDRGRYLKETLGLPDQVVASIARSDYAFEDVQALQEVLKKRHMDGGDLMNVRDFYGVNYPSKQLTDDGALSSVMTSKADSFSLEDFYKDPDQKLPFSLKLLNQHKLAPERSREETEALLSKNYDSAFLAHQKLEATNAPQKAKQAAKDLAEKAFNEYEIYTLTMQKSDARKVLLEGIPTAERKELVDFTKNIATKVKDRFNLIKQKPETVSPQLFTIMKKLKIDMNGFIQGGSVKEREVAYNYIRREVVDKELMFFKSADGSIPVENIDAVKKIKSYYSEYFTLTPEDVFLGQVYDQNGVLTHNFVDFIQDKGDKEISVSKGTKGVRSKIYTPEEIKDMTNQYYEKTSADFL